MTIPELPKTHVDWGAKLQPPLGWDKVWKTTGPCTLYIKLKVSWRKRIKLLFTGTAVLTFTEKEPASGGTYDEIKFEI